MLEYTFSVFEDVFNQHDKWQEAFESQSSWQNRYPTQSLGLVQPGIFIAAELLLLNDIDFGVVALRAVVVVRIIYVKAIIRENSGDNPSAYNNKSDKSALLLARLRLLLR